MADLRRGRVKWTKGALARILNRNTVQFGMEDWVPFLSTELGSNWTVETTAAYFKDPFGIVHLKGRMDATAAPASGETIATLPDGYRPEQTLRFAVASNNNVGAASAQSLAGITIDTAGVIAFLDLTSGEPYAVTTDVWFDGVTFRAPVETI